MNLRFPGALWARVFTSTSKVSIQCISRLSSPALRGSPLSPEPPERPRQRDLSGKADRMPPPTDQADRRIRRAVAPALVVALLLVGSPAAARTVTTGSASAEGAGGDELAERGWVWPARPFRLSRAYVAPAHDYGPGHRGVDLDLLGGTEVRAPAAGVVAFAGDVAGRGILTIDHGDGLVTTLEPVQTALTPGVLVAPDDIVATLSAGGHAEAGMLHFGVRLHGDYINPMLLLGGVPRAVLLPCCD